MWLHDWTHISTQRTIESFFLKQVAWQGSSVTSDCKKNFGETRVVNCWVYSTFHMTAIAWTLKWTQKWTTPWSLVKGSKDCPFPCSFQIAAGSVMHHTLLCNSHSVIDDMVGVVIQTSVTVHWTKWHVCTVCLIYDHSWRVISSGFLLIFSIFSSIIEFL